VNIAVDSADTVLSATEEHPIIDLIDGGGRRGTARGSAPSGKGAPGDDTPAHRPSARAHKLYRRIRALKTMLAGSS
jgi:hypothetical protein